MPLFMQLTSRATSMDRLIDVPRPSGCTLKSCLTSFEKSLSTRQTSRTTGWVMKKRALPVASAITCLAQAHCGRERLTLITLTGAMAGCGCRRILKACVLYYMYIYVICIHVYIINVHLAFQKVGNI